MEAAGLGDALVIKMHKELKILLHMCQLVCYVHGKARYMHGKAIVMCMCQKSLETNPCTLYFVLQHTQGVYTNCTSLIAVSLVTHVSKQLWTGALI